MPTTIQFPRTTDLPRELANLLRQIPHGQVSTYGDLALALGDKSAARWVGTWMLDHSHDDACPCHRVVRVNGEAGLYIAGDAGEKLDRLESEGVPISDGRVDLKSRFASFDSSAPLQALSRFQTEVPRHLKLTQMKRPPRLIAGIDVAYPSPGVGVVAYTLIDADSLETQWEQALELPVTFPYVSGYLAFRELSLMLEVWRVARAAGQAADVVFIDGNGYLHPRRAGIACCFGLIADVPTVGIGKSLLCGAVDLDDMTAEDLRPITSDDELIGIALKSQDYSKPVFASPGHRIDFEGAAELSRTLMDGHRLPEPVHRADRLSKQSRET